MHALRRVPCCLPRPSFYLLREGWCLHTPRRLAASVTAQELRAALSTLGLSDGCTDAEVKAAYQRFAKENHPDTLAHRSSSSSNISNNGGGGDRMAAGTEAYQLLRRHGFEERRMILRSGRAAGGSGYNFSAEEFAKAEAMYRGRPRSSSSHSHSGSHSSSGGGGDFGDPDFFSSSTAQGRRRTAFFNQQTSRIEMLRQRAGRNAAPWKVADGDGTYTRAHHHQQQQQQQEQERQRGGSSSSGSSGRGGRPQADVFAALWEALRQRGGAAGFATTWRGLLGQPLGPGPGFSLRFYLSQIREDIALLRQRSAVDPTFAGIRGHRFDGPEQKEKLRGRVGARAYDEASPELRHYLLMKQRAQERALVDAAVGRLWWIAVALLWVVVLVIAAVAVVRSRRGAKRYAEMKAEREERGEGG